MPKDLRVSILGSAKKKSGDLLHIALDIKFERGNETISVRWKEKDLKVWPRHAVNEMTEQDLADKFDNWIQKLDVGDSFKSFVIRAASKAKPGVTTWLLSLTNIRIAPQ